MRRASRQNATPVVSRICDGVIVELLYDSRKRATALAIGSGDRWTTAPRFKTAQGEILVPYAADNTLIRHECVLLPSRPVPAGSKEELLRDIQAYLHRYVDMSPTFERLMAHYVLLSWVFDAFNELPYLRFQGDFGSGKTRALIVLGSIVYKGFFASGASTVSPIFHTLDAFGGTLVLDEADLRHSGKTADLVKILNNGTVKGLPVLRTVQNRYKEFNPAAFTVFGPKIVAMRGRFRDEALESRFLTETMGDRPLRDDVPIQLPNALKAEALDLRNRLLGFRLANLFAVKSNAARLVAGIDPRLNQTALSLASLIDDPGLLAEFEDMLRARHDELGLYRSRNLARRTMAALAKAFEERPRAYVPLREIAERLNATTGEQGSPASPREIGRILRRHSVPLHKSGGNIVAAKAPPGVEV
ncbi:MAG TPA: hypothetical protein VMF32_23050 [Xanthobacteraceae bacterium]|nr:hypothetical protein [Xanthobacteraceae bacterium]